MMAARYDIIGGNGRPMLSALLCRALRVFPGCTERPLVAETCPQYECENNDDSGKPREHVPIVLLLPWRCATLLNGHSPAPVQRVTYAADFSNLTGRIEREHHRADAARHARPAEPAQ